MTPHRVQRRTAARRLRAFPWRPLGRAAVAAAVLGIPVAALALLVRIEYGPLRLLDEETILRATDLVRSTPALHRALLAWQTAFQAVWVNPVAIGVCLWVWRRTGMRGRSLWAVTTILVSWALALGTKYVVQRARPVVDDAVEVASGFSFPSGHVTNIATVVLALAVLLWPVLSRGGRVALCAVGAALVLATAADRVLLGVHYPSDAAAGVAFAAAIVAGSFVGYRGWAPGGPAGGSRHRPPGRSPGGPTDGDGGATAPGLPRSGT